MQRAILTLLAGGALAQLLPLLLGPWLTRVYSPADFGEYHLFAAVAANVAVVACARYEFALPLARDNTEADTLLVLCRRLLLLTISLSALAALAWAAWTGTLWPLWLPAAVGALGLVSLATLNATRAQRFRGLALARVLQHGGGALLQLLAGLWLAGSVGGSVGGSLGGHLVNSPGAGVTGLIAAPVLAALLALAALGWPARTGAAVPTFDTLRAVARQHRSFPLLNTPHAFLGALQDTLAIALIAAHLGPAAAGAWGLSLRYLKAPASLVGGAVSQVLYPQLVATTAAGGGCTAEGRALVRRAMALLALLATPLVLGLWWLAPALFAWAFGPDWRSAGDLARALALYVGLHFVASPLGVVTMAWQAQGWALKLALVGQLVFVAALALGLAWGGLRGAGWAVSGGMAVYFGWYFLKLATWPLAATAPATGLVVAP